MPACKQKYISRNYAKAKHHSIATQRYLPYAIWQSVWQWYGIRHSIDISLYSDVTRQAVLGIIGVTITSDAMSRHIQETLWRECHSNGDSPFPALLSKCDCPQKSSHADTPLVSFYAILRQPRAIVIATRLHYAPFLSEIDNFR